MVGTSTACTLYHDLIFGTGFRTSWLTIFFFLPQLSARFQSVGGTIFQRNHKALNNFKGGGLNWLSPHFQDCTVCTIQSWNVYLLVRHVPFITKCAGFLLQCTKCSWQAPLYNGKLMSWTFCTLQLESCTFLDKRHMTNQQIYISIALLWN